MVDDEAFGFVDVTDVVGNSVPGCVPEPFGVTALMIGDSAPASIF